MNFITRLIRADHTRKSRFHTSNGYLCLDPAEVAMALITTANRILLGRYSPKPWLVFSATKYIEPRIMGTRLFEFGSGMSTLWFSERCKEVFSVESNENWARLVKSRLIKRANVTVNYAPSKDEYITSISLTGGKFDVIVIDGQYRLECLEALSTHLNRGGVVIIDNTDRDPILASRAMSVFADAKIHRFRGWAPGNLHANETTVIETADSSTP